MSSEKTMKDSVTDAKSKNPLDVLINAAFFKSSSTMREHQRNRGDKESARASDRGNVRSAPHSILSSHMPPSRPLGPFDVSQLANLNINNERVHIRDSFVSPLQFHEDWRTEKDKSSRCRIMEEIAKLILKKRPNKPRPKNLTAMVKQVELFLYRGAPNMEAYCNVLTLERRLDSLAAVLKRKMKTPKPDDSVSSDSSSVVGTLSFADVGSKKHLDGTIPDVAVSSPHAKVQFRVRHKQGYSYAA